MAISHPEPYVNADHPQAPPGGDHLTQQLAAALNGGGGEDWLSAFKADLENGNEPDSLAAVEDEFKADTEATPDSLAVRIGRGDWGTPTTTTN